MKKLEKRRASLLSKLKAKIKSFLKDKCFCFRNFLNSITKDMCFSKEELEEIKNRVNKTKESEKKFDEFSVVAPEILNLIERLKNDVDVLTKEKQFCMDGIKDIYIADVNGYVEEKERLFAKFGLPFILQK